MNDGICRLCGAGLPTTHGRRMFCSIKCNRAAQRAKSARLTLRPQIECAGCHEDFIPKRSDSTTCSRDCWYVARGSKLPQAIPPRRCALSACGKSFNPRRSNEKCCCEDHGKRYWREANLDKIKANREPWNDRRKAEYHKRRALKKSASTGAPVLPSEICERDGWICHLCDSIVPMDALYPDPLSQSMDHVVPLARGGIHDPSNVKLAHLRCNLAKGDRLATA